MKFTIAFLGTQIITQCIYIPAGVHVFPVSKEDLKKMKQRIANLFKERQECQGIAFVIGIHGPAGTDVDIDNVCSTFSDLNFAVWRERDITCADLACLVKAAASHKYPSYKYVAFYFAGHGGSVNGHPFVVPMKLKGDGSQQILNRTSCLVLRNLANAVCSFSIAAWLLKVLKTVMNLPKLAKRSSSLLLLNVLLHMQQLRVINHKEIRFREDCGLVLCVQN